MQPPLRINKTTLSPDASVGRVCDMAGACAFAICTKGHFRVKILNEEYEIRERCLLTCIPFVSIEIMDVYESTELIFGNLLLEDVPRMINRWVNTNNVITIQNNPLVHICQSQFNLLTGSIEVYLKYIEEAGISSNIFICNRILKDMIQLQCSLIIGQVIKIYFSSIRMDDQDLTHQDIVFQQFIIGLYSNFLQHHDVRFYASRSGVSPKYFSTIIRRNSGKTPSEWIETVIISEAKNLLADSRKSIKDVAAILNFPDAPTFTKYFHRVTGLTPKTYRQTLS